MDMQFRITSMFAEDPAVDDELGDQVERSRRRRRLCHVSVELGPAELPLGVRLRLDALIGV